MSFTVFDVPVAGGPVIHCDTLISPSPSDANIKTHLPRKLIGHCYFCENWAELRSTPSALVRFAIAPTNGTIRCVVSLSSITHSSGVLSPRRQHPQLAHDEARVVWTIRCIDERAQLLCPPIKVVSHHCMHPWLLLGCRSAESAKWWYCRLGSCHAGLLVIPTSIFRSCDLSGRARGFDLFPTRHAP